MPKAEPESGSLLQPKRPRGRPKGSKNHAKPETGLSPLLQLLGAMLTTLHLQLTYLQVKHIVLHGYFGNYPSIWLVQQMGLHIISKMKCNAALYLPYTSDKLRRGPTPP